MRGAGLATSRLLRYPSLSPEEPPLKIVWEEEQRDVIEAAWREEHWFALPPQGTKFGKVERVALQRAAAIPWLARRCTYVPRQRGSGASGFYGVFERASGRWMVQLSVDGKDLYVGLCDDKEDAARLVDIISVVVNREAPENFPELVQDFLDAGGHGDAPAELVAAALQRVGDVDVKRAASVEAAEALAAASSLKKEIDEAIAADDVKCDRALMKLSDDRFFSCAVWSTPRIKGAKWMRGQGSHMVANGVITVRDLALVDVNNRGLAMALTLAGSYGAARKTLWSRKGAAAKLLGVNIGELPKLQPGGQPKEERTPAHQRALDVASRWVAHAGTPDPAFVKDYADALAVIARRQLSKKSSGCDDGAEPPKKRHC